MSTVSYCDKIWGVQFPRVVRAARRLRILVLDTNICTEELHKNVSPGLFPIYYQSMVARCAKSLMKHQASLSHLTLKDLPFDSKMVVEFLSGFPTSDDFLL